MEPGNETGVSGFLLLGFSEESELQSFTFGHFLSMYLITVLGNWLIILAVSSDSHLHTPMYFFRSDLSFVDICFTSTTIPKMLVNIQMQSKVITYAGCITQLYFFVLHGLSMSMNHQICGILLLVSWITSVLHSFLQTSMVLQLSFCTHVEIPHFFCELNQMIQLACSNTFLNDMVMYFTAMLMCGGPLAGIIYSYFKIVCCICGISSAQGKYKAFSTCASHLSVVSLFFCTSLGVYFSSTASQSSHSSAIASLVYTVVTPMLNPFIYSLRNKEVKVALKGFFRMASTKGPVILGQKKCPRLQDSKPQSQNCASLTTLQK
nr:olfactory receptor-like protein OLF4 [Equus caballus]